MQAGVMEGMWMDGLFDYFIIPTYIYSDTYLQ